MKELMKKIKSGNFRAGIYNLSRSGITIAIKLASKNIPVTAFDISEQKLRTLSNGTMPYKEPGTEGLLKEVLKNNKIEFTAHEDKLSSADVIFICVDVSLDEDILPDYTAFISCLKSLKHALRRNQLLIIRGLVSPGGYNNIIKPFIEDMLSLAVGKEIFLTVCPERMMGGSIMTDLETLPQIIGGNDEFSLELSRHVFDKIGIKCSLTTDPVSAELAKLFSDVSRYVNFALANEYAILAEHYGVDVHNIINMLNHDYPREKIAIPGPCGGPNFSKNGLILLGNTPHPDFILNAWKLNENVPAYLFTKLKARLVYKGKQIENCKIGVLGMAYKADVEDLRQSPAIRLIDILKQSGAKVYAYDPMCSSDGLDTLLNEADAVIAMTNHSEFEKFKPETMLGSVKQDCIFLDVWGIWRDEEWRQSGMDIITFGSPSPSI